MKNQILEDIGISAIPDEEDTEAQLAEGTLEIPHESLEDDSIFDIYSFSTQDLVTKYRQLARLYTQTGNVKYQDAAELIEVELLKNGYEIKPIEESPESA